MPDEVVAAVVRELVAGMKFSPPAAPGTRRRIVLSPETTQMLVDSGVLDYMRAKWPDTVVDASLWTADEKDSPHA